VIERADDLRGFARLREAWDALYAASGASNPFVTWEWLDTWTRHLGERGFVALLHRPRRDAPADAAVLFDASQPDRWCSVSEHSYRAGVLHLPGIRAPLRPFLLHALARARHVRRVCLHRAEDTPVLRADLDAALGPFRFLAVEREQVASRLIDLSPSYEAYLAARDKKVRSELRRKDRQLAGAALTELPTDAGGAAALALIARVEEDSWKAAEATAIASSAREQAFYAAVFQLATPRTRGRLFALEGAAGPIAFVIGVQHDDVFYALKTSYRLDHQQLSPGQVLFGRLVERFSTPSSGVHHLELLGVDQRWKRELATRHRDERTLEIHRPDPRGLVTALAYTSAPHLRAAAARDPRVARLVDLAKRARARIRPTPQETP
jgi:CelD/BcsL family acetyltransferase involved in cellulose biosynthesis